MTSPSPRSPAVVPRGTGRPADPVLPSPMAPAGQGTRPATVTPAVAGPTASGVAASKEVHAQLPSSNPIADGMTEAQRRRMRTAGGKYASEIAKAMSEVQLENGLRRILKDLPSVRGFHAYDSRRSAGEGFPDWCLVGPGGVLYRELKTMRGRITRAQDEWLFALTDAGQNADVWRPDALLSGRVARELAAIAGLGEPRLRRAREGDFGGPIRTGNGGQR